MFLLRLRALLVWALVTLGAALVAVWALGPDPSGGSGAERLLAQAAGLALAACAAWAWVVTSVVVLEATRGAVGASRPVRGVPRWARRWVLAACGVALCGATPAYAGDTIPAPPSAETHTVVGTADPLGGLADPALLEGLRLPDRTTGPAHAAPTGSWVRVRPGDSLWRIAGSLLGPGASPASTARLSATLYDLNRAVIGADPDLITPGTHLRTPRTVPGQHAGHAPAPH